MEWFGNGSLDGVRGRHVLRSVFNKKNLTMEDIQRFVSMYFFLKYIFNDFKLYNNRYIVEFR